MRPAYWIAFGPHGPRAVDPPGENWRVFYATMIGIGVAAVIFTIQRALAKPPPSTLTREWQEASNEYLKVGHALMLTCNPVTFRNCIHVTRSQKDH